MRVAIALTGTVVFVVIILAWLCALVSDYSTAAHRNYRQRLTRCFGQLTAWWPWR